ncbi:MAG: hypothetical protein ACOY3D_05945 [Candidatus Omnitrophota bacterium]
MKNKNVYIIAGPNGSGKTTFAKRFLPDYVNCPNFVNADLIVPKAWRLLNRGARQLRQESWFCSR